METSDLMIIDCHHKAFRVMTNYDRMGQIFLSHPHKNNGSFSCTPLNMTFLCISSSIRCKSTYLRNEFNFWNVHGIIKTSGLLQSK